jgi:hypothetical protein
MHIVQALWNVYVTTTHTSQLSCCGCLYLECTKVSQPEVEWIVCLALSILVVAHTGISWKMFETFIVHHHRPTDRPIFDTFLDDQPIQKIVHSQMLYKTFLVTALKRCFSWKYFSMNSWVLIHKYKLNLKSDYCYKINKCFDRYLHS